MTKPYEPKTYYMLALDPIHVGTGGYRLGRVDNTITRDPGTNLPKIPGSSIAGVSRAYTAMAIQSENNEDPVRIEERLWVIDYEKYKKWKYQRPDYDFLQEPSSDIIKYNSEGKAIIKPNTNGPMIRKDKNQKDIYYSCAGKGVNDGEGHCGSPDCEVCIAFGFSKQSGSFQGLAQFSDARILFFPVHSMIGPVWITCSSVLKEYEIAERSTLTYDDEQIQTDLVDKDKQLNLGWIHLKNREKSAPITETLKVPGEIFNRLVLVSDKLFPRIVNDNLEVRTSVAIDPATGAAEEKALFTYEAIPRATILCFDVVYNKPEYFRIKMNDSDAPIQTGKPAGEGWKWVEENVVKGIKLMEYLGVGGMNTRGMGRLKYLE